jgi:hypothetical protein
MSTSGISGAWECPSQRPLAKSKRINHWSKRGLQQQPQLNHSIDAKFSNSLARPVYLLTSLGLLGLREADSAQQVNIARIGANVVPKWVY